MDLRTTVGLLVGNSKKMKLLTSIGKITQPCSQIPFSNFNPLSHFLFILLSLSLQLFSTHCGCNFLSLTAFYLINFTLICTLPSVPGFLHLLLFLFSFFVCSILYLYFLSLFFNFFLSLLLIPFFFFSFHRMGRV